MSLTEITDTIIYHSNRECPQGGNNNEINTIHQIRTNNTKIRELSDQTVNYYVPNGSLTHLQEKPWHIPLNQGWRFVHTSPNSSKMDGQDGVRLSPRDFKIDNYVPYIVVCRTSSRTRSHPTLLESPEKSQCIAWMTPMMMMRDWNV